MGLLPFIISWACRGLDVGLAVHCFFFLRISGLAACFVTIFFFPSDFTSKVLLGFFFWLESRKNNF